MLTLALETLVGVVGGELLFGDPATMINGLATDSRHVEPGNAFIAFPGEHVDGHSYIHDAVSLGARALLVTEEPDAIADKLQAAAEREVAAVRVADALGAVQALAAYHRGRLFCPVIGVTGSTGKTTTKDFLHSVLTRSSRVVATEGNQNNELGVPFTILRAGADTDVLVVEMAMRGMGQIADLCDIALPTAGLVTNVGTSHIELLGTQDAIREAKGELVRAIPPEGRVFLNGDDSKTDKLMEDADAEVILYGLDERCCVRAIDVELDKESRPSFTLRSSAGDREVALLVPGRHNVYNALAAAAVALWLEIPIDEIVCGLQEAHAGDMRMQVFQSATGIQVINDAYNANPSSMRAAIETLAGIETTGARVAVLGDMAELGSLTELAHFRIGEEVARLPIDRLVTVGHKASRIADGAAAEGMDREMIHRCDSALDAAELVSEMANMGDVVLVKASRVMGLEVVVERIVEPGCST